MGADTLAAGALGWSGPRSLARAVGLCLLALLLARPAAADLRLLSLPTKDLVYDSFRQRIYASVPSAGGARANTVTTIDPETGAVGASIAVGPNPGKLALSDDGRYLYVNLEFAAGIDRIDLTSGRRDLHFSTAVGQNPADPVQDMDVVPGSPHALAAASSNVAGGFPAATAAIYDDGLPRPKTVAASQPGAPNLSLRRLEFGAPTRLYGLAYDGGQSIYRMSVDSTGVVLQDSFAPFASPNFRAQDFEFLDGLLYFNSGEVVDPEARRQVHAFGQFDSRTLVRPDAQSGRVFFLGGNFGAYTFPPPLLAFDLRTHQPVGTLALPLTFDQASSLITWGRDGLAFRTDRDQVVLLRTRLRTPDVVVADVTVTGGISPPLVRVGETVTSRLRVHNYGPNAVAGVLLETTVPAGTTLVAVSSSQGRCMQSGDRITCELGDLAPDAEATVTVELRAATSGPVSQTASVRSQTPDLNARNDTTTLHAQAVTPLPSPTDPAGRLPSFGLVASQIMLAARDLAYDPVSRRIYASVPSSAGEIGNSVVAIDPETGAVGGPIFVGSEPGKLALSDDGRYLYVALDGAGAVRRVELGAQAAGLQFSLGNDPTNGPYMVEDMQVLPGAPESLAIARQFQGGFPRHAGVVIYDNDAPRPSLTPAYSGSNAIEFSASAMRLYGYDNQTPEAGFRRMEVDDLGVRVRDVTSSLITGFDTDIRFNQGLLFSTKGQVIDPEARLLVGTVPNLDEPSLVAPDHAAGLLFYLTGVGGIRQLRLYDSGSFRPLATLGIPGVKGRPGSLIRWGSERTDGGGLAFLTDQNQLFLLRITLQEPVDLTLAVEPGSVDSGSPAIGRVTLAAPAPAGGAVVDLASSDPALAATPPSVTVPAGATSAAFPITTQLTQMQAEVSIAATYRGTFRSVPLVLLPDLRPTLVRLLLGPPSLAGGLPGRGAVDFSRPVPPAGVKVFLSSSNPALVDVPTSVTGQPGQRRAEFPIRTRPVTTPTEVTLSATYNGVTQTAKLTLLPPPPASAISLALNPNRVIGGGSVVATVTLSSPAPEGGRGVGLDTDSPSVVTLPKVVVVPAGATQAIFRVTTVVVTQSRPVSIWAAAGVVSYASLQVDPPLPPSVFSLLLDPDQVVSGGSTTGVVTLADPAPQTGAVVSLSTSSPVLVTIPPRVTVPAGTKSVTFPIATSGDVTAPTDVRITGVYAGQNRVATLKLLPAPRQPEVVSFTINPTEVAGGAPATGTVTLSRIAPPGGRGIGLVSDAPTLVSLPQQVVVPAGATRATFPITTSRVLQTTRVSLRAAAGQVIPAEILLQPRPSLLSSLSLSPTPVTGGSAVTGTLALDGPAPSGGASITLSSSIPAVAPVAASVTIPAGTQQISFTITTQPVTTPTDVLITAQYAGDTRTATLRLLPPPPSVASLTLSASRVVAGESVEATLTLSGPAPAGGRGVGLGKTDPAGALKMPAQVVVPAGATTARFTIQTNAVTAPTRVPIWAVAGVVVEASLEILPSTPPPVSTFSIQPNAVIGGGTVTGTITLLYPARSGGRGVGLTTPNPTLVSIPSQLVVPAGADRASFPIPTQPVSEPMLAEVWSAAGVVRTAQVMLLPQLGLTSASPTVKGGENVKLTIVLPAPAPAEGARIALIGTPSEVLTAPTIFRVVPGQVYGSVRQWTELVTQPTPVTFTASYGGQTWTTTVTVMP